MLTPVTSGIGAEICTHTIQLMSSGQPFDSQHIIRGHCPCGAPRNNWLLREVRRTSPVESSRPPPLMPWNLTLPCSKHQYPLPRTPSKGWRKAQMVLRVSIPTLQQPLRPSSKTKPTPFKGHFEPSMTSCLNFVALCKMSYEQYVWKWRKFDQIRPGTSAHSVLIWLPQSKVNAHRIDVLNLDTYDGTSNVIVLDSFLFRLEQYFDVVGVCNEA